MIIKIPIKTKDPLTKYWSNAKKRDENPAIYQPILNLEPLPICAAESHDIASIT